MIFSENSCEFFRSYWGCIRSILKEFRIHKIIPISPDLFQCHTVCGPYTICLATSEVISQMFYFVVIDCQCCSNSDDEPCRLMEMTLLLCKVCLSVTKRENDSWLRRGIWPAKHNQGKAKHFNVFCNYKLCTWLIIIVKKFQLFQFPTIKIFMQCDTNIVKILKNCLVCL